MLIFNIYIGQHADSYVSLLGPTMLDPTPVSHSIAIIYLVARFFRLFVLSTMGWSASFSICIVLFSIIHLSNLILFFSIIGLFLARGFDELL